MPIGYLWQTFLETPLVNLMVVLTGLAFGSYGLAILLFTVLSRVVTFPLTLRTLTTMKKMQELQPLLQDVQKKYTDPRRRSEETMKLYREYGVNPLGCLGPQLLQFPLFIALYQVVRITLASTPDAVLYLEQRLYPFHFIHRQVPLNRHFLFFDLGQNGGIGLGVLVFAGMWLQQRISASRSRQQSQTQQGAQQQQMNQMMQWMMPLMFSWFVLFVPSGLGIYWAASTVIGLVLQWYFVGPGDFTWGELVPAIVRQRVFARAQTAGATPTSASAHSDPGPHTESRSEDESPGSKRANRRRGSRQGPPADGTEPRTGRRRRHPGG